MKFCGFLWFSPKTPIPGPWEWMWVYNNHFVISPVTISYVTKFDTNMHIFLCTDNCLVRLAAKAVLYIPKMKVLYINIFIGCCFPLAPQQQAFFSCEFWKYTEKQNIHKYPENKQNHRTRLKTCLTAFNTTLVIEQKATKVSETDVIVSLCLHLISTTKYPELQEQHIL